MYVYYITYMYIILYIYVSSMYNNIIIVLLLCNIDNIIIVLLLLQLQALLTHNNIDFTDVDHADDDNLDLGAVFNR